MTDIYSFVGVLGTATGLLLSYRAVIVVHYRANAHTNEVHCGVRTICTVSVISLDVGAVVAVNSQYSHG